MIVFDKVSFQYGNEETDEPSSGIHNISFHIGKGQCAILCGRSGAGKSTVLRLVSGLMPNFYTGELSGTVTVNGKYPGVFLPDEKVQTLGVVFQDPRSQFFMGKVLDEIAFSAENIGMDSAQIIEKVMLCAKQLEIEELLEKNVNELSSGQKQRVAIAAATVFAPPVLILDEPVSNLDNNGIKILLKILTEIKEKGTTIIISEHRLHQFLPIADLYLHIDGGNLQHIWEKSDFENLQYDDLMNWGIRHPDLVKKKQKLAASIDELSKTVEIDHITFKYRKANYGLDNISTLFPSGTVTAILGENGAGKTTFCKILCGLLKQNSGTVKRDGIALSPSKRRSISYLVMQDADYQIYADSVGNELVY